MSKKSTVSKYKTIALVANSTWNIHNFRLNLLDKFIGEGHDVIVIAPVDQYIEYKEKYPAVKHVALRSLDRDSTNPLKDLVLITELTRKYKRLKPDLVIHFTNKPNIYGALAARRAKIDSIAIVTGLGYAFIHNGFIKSVTTALYKYTSKYHKKFIFENIEDRELFENENIITEGQGISVKGCGVNTTYFHPYPNQEVNEAMVFTFVGRLLYDKGVKEFVEAARIIKLVHPKTQFWLVGELDPDNPATVEKDELIEWVDSDIVYYHGFQRDVRPFISKSDCVVLPSYREAIPRTITEAMAMAKPVITTDTAGCREAVEVEVNGYLAKLRDANDLAESMQKIISLTEEERKSMGQAGRNIVMNQFDDRLIANHIYDIISKI
uniref:Glycosyl transferases group 1 n=1 Tax=uncultured Sphingobacteriia bacterium TaxID=246143 RepID=F4MM68_9BACT|nr:glycosyl transferase family GT4 [uncultured bacterium]CBL87231.1 glycosyl transferases group 1 [uncultured Sphingobacteriia bacterium]